MTADDLAQLRADLPECELAVFADVFSGTVLAADAALKHPQENLDALCAEAARLFSGAGAFEGAEPDTAVVLTSVTCRAFFRDPAEPGEALCCLCAPGVPPERLLEAGRAAFAGAG
ncbi:hypothetical protein [Rhodosalinus sp. 5P4]|uniref:hypothetical protein n=1 Tax=Rhodosalinus sp. 5P4 TaxID=3239196 RepID=UPI003525D989